MKVNTVAELINNHSDEEIIEYLNGIISGVVKNYKVSLEKGDSNVLWANLGDISLVSSILRALYKRNQERLANRPE